MEAESSRNYHVTYQVDPNVVVDSTASKVKKPSLIHANSWSEQEISLVDLRETTQELPSQEADPDTKFMTSRNPPKNIWRIVSFCFWMVVTGSNDATAGVLLPYIQEQYHLSYSLVSLIWLGNSIGFVILASVSHKVQPWLGHRNSLVAGCFFHLVMFSVVLSGTLFPVIVLSYVLGGIGQATVLSKANVFLASFGEKLSKYLSIAQSMYGFGATVSPIIATTMTGAGVKWNYYFLILLGMMGVTCSSFYFSFTGADRDLRPWEHDDSEDNTSGDNSVFKEAMKNKITWVLAFFVFFYQGAEVAMGGWIVTYLLDYRHANNSVGYVASGFWGGVALGRLFLVTPIHKSVGGRRGIILCSLASLVFCAITWAIPHVIVAAIFVAFVGLSVGPNYPLMISEATKILPRKIHTVSLTVASAFGSAGGAFFPFLVGLVSQRVGAFVVFPAFLILYSAMLALWLTLPNRDRLNKGQTKMNIWQRLW